MNNKQCTVIALLLAVFCLLSACGRREETRDLPEEPASPLPQAAAPDEGTQPAPVSQDQVPPEPAQEPSIDPDPDHPDMEGILDALDGSALTLIPGERIVLDGGVIAGAQPFGDDAPRVQVELAEDVVIQVLRIDAAGGNSDLQAGGMEDLQPGSSLNLWGRESERGFVATLVRIVQVT